MLRCFTVLFVSILGLASAPAVAATLTVFEQDEPGWLAAVGGGVVVEDFSDAILAPGLTILGGGTIDLGVYWDNVDDDPLLTTTWEFAPDVTAVGAYFDLSLYTPGTGIEFQAVFAGGGTQSLFLENVDANVAFVGFFGVASDTPIDRVVLSGGIDPYGLSEAYFVDDIVFVPEPGRATLAGVAALVWARRRGSRPRRAAG